MATAEASLSPKTLRRSRLGLTRSIATPAIADRSIDRSLSLSSTARTAVTNVDQTEASDMGREPLARLQSFGTAAQAEPGQTVL